MHFNPGDTIDEKYKVLSILGTGGFGSVYLVNEMQLNRTVALKVLTRFSVHDPIHLKRFEREAQILSKMSHPNIVGVHRFGWIEKKAPYLVLENVQGESLRDRLVRESALSCSDSVEIARQMAVALSYALSHSVIHRDLKPENLLIASDERDGVFVKLIDFGLSKQSSSLAETLTDTGAVFGTPNYMSPEHCLGKELTFQSDIYSLGCMLFEMICGTAPFESKNLPDTILKQVSHPTPSIGADQDSNQVSSMLDKIIGKCTNKNPTERYSDYESLIQALSDDSLLNCKQKLNSNRAAPSKGIKKLPITGAIALGVICLIVGGAALFNYQNSMSRSGKMESLLNSATSDCRGCSPSELEYSKFEKLLEAGFKPEAREYALSTLKLLLKSSKEKIEASPFNSDNAVDRKDIDRLEKISSFLLADTSERLQWSRIYTVLSARTNGESSDDVILKLPFARNTVKLKITAALKKGSINEILADDIVGYCWRLAGMGDKDKKQYIDIASSFIQKYRFARRECELHLFLTDYYLERGELENAQEQFTKAESVLKELKQANSDGVAYLDNDLNYRAQALKRKRISTHQ